LPCRIKESRIDGIHLEVSNNLQLGEVINRQQMRFIASSRMMMGTFFFCVTRSRICC
jgi:hypothetical protein